MGALPLALILGSVALSAAAQVLLKLGVTAVRERLPVDATVTSTVIVAFVDPAVIGGLGLYAVGAVLWIGALSRADLSQAYPFVGLGFVLTSAISYTLLGETPNVGRLVGTALVVLGVVVIAGAG